MTRIVTAPVVTGGNRVEPAGEAADRSEAVRFFQLIQREMLGVEAELERQARTNIQIIDNIGKYLQRSGGKRVRPALLILSAKLFGDEIDDAVIRLAAVMEFLHTATLVHDDIIDGAGTRRGKPSVSARWGNDTAVLMGDWLYMSAYETALRERSLGILDTLTEATRKMTEGELIQLSLLNNLKITEEQHLDIASRKTGYLFSASCRVGAILRGGTVEQQQAMAAYGLNLGIAFQLIDDLLDFTADARKLGKPVLSDLREGKVTLPLIRLLKKHPEHLEVVREAVEEPVGESVRAERVLDLLVESGELKRARDEAGAYVRRAQDSLGIFPETLYRRALYDIAQYIIDRDR
ncbi:MAG: polyprenyl synthetase family protein [Blastocatellia bacterium]